MLKGVKNMEIFEELFTPSFLNNGDSRPPIPKDASVTMAYIPLQETLETYSENDALKNGTLYPQLDKVFKGRMINNEK